MAPATPIVRVAHTITPADATTNQVRVTRSHGSASMTNIVATAPDPEDSTHDLVNVELTQNTFPDNLYGDGGDGPPRGRHSRTAAGARGDERRGCWRAARRRR